MTTDEHRSCLACRLGRQVAQIGEKKEGYADLADLNPVTEKIIGCAFTVSNT